MSDDDRVGGDIWHYQHAHSQGFVLPAMVGSHVMLGTRHHPTQVFTDLCSNTSAGFRGSVTLDESFTFCVLVPTSQEALYTWTEFLV